MIKDTIRLQEMIISLRTRLLVMCAEVSIGLENAQSSFIQQDVGRAKAVIEGDIEINALEDEIDERALCILVRNQPVAGDLRFIISALRMVADLERIGDEAVSIAEHVVLMQEFEHVSMGKDVMAFMTSMREAYDSAISSFRNNDVKLAMEVCKTEADAMQGEVTILHKIMDEIYDEKSRLDSRVAMHIILIVHSLTRIWRRSINIAEHVYFINQGVSLKHCNLDCDENK